jgi:hypothetical protein
MHLRDIGWGLCPSRHCTDSADRISWLWARAGAHSNWSVCASTELEHRQRFPRSLHASEREKITIMRYNDVISIVYGLPARELCALRWRIFNRGLTQTTLLRYPWTLPWILYKCWVPLSEYSLRLVPCPKFPCQHVTIPWGSSKIYHFCANTKLFVEAHPKFTISVPIPNSSLRLIQNLLFLCQSRTLRWGSSKIYHFCANPKLFVEAHPKFTISVPIPNSSLSLVQNLQCLCWNPLLSKKNTLQLRRIPTN